MQLEEETRTNIEELYAERIAAFNIALNEQILKTKQTEVLCRFYKNKVNWVNFERKKLIQGFTDDEIKMLYIENEKLNKENEYLKKDIKYRYKHKTQLDYIKKLYKEGKPFLHLLEK